MCLQARECTPGPFYNSHPMCRRLACWGRLLLCFRLQGKSHADRTKMWYLAELSHDRRGQATSNVERGVCRSCQQLFVPCSANKWESPSSIGSILRGGRVGGKHIANTPRIMTQHDFKVSLWKVGVVGLLVGCQGHPLSDKAVMGVTHIGITDSEIFHVLLFFDTTGPVVVGFL